MRRMFSAHAATHALAALAAATLIGPLGISTAQAAPFVDVTYNLDDSSAVSLVDTGFGIILETVAPPQLTGTMTVRYASDSGSGIAHGPVSVRTFDIQVLATIGLTYVTVSGATGTSIINTADLHFQLTSPVGGGTLLSGGTVDPQGGIGQIRVTGVIHCYLLCGALDVPVSTTTPIQTTTFSQVLANLYGAFGSTVTGTQYATFMVDPGPAGGQGVNAIATNFLVGREVLREHVPEPGTLPLLSAGVIGLVALAVGRRLARARR